MPAPISCSVVQLRWPSSISEALAVVPPMSKVIRFGRPTLLPISSPPTTPAAGPDSTIFTGVSAACLADMMPPLDCMMCTGAEISVAPSWSASESR